MWRRRYRCLTRSRGSRAAGRAAGCAPIRPAGRPSSLGALHAEFTELSVRLRSRAGGLVVHVQPRRAALLHAAAARPDPRPCRPVSSRSGRGGASRRDAAAQRDLGVGGAGHLEPGRRSRPVHALDPRGCRGRVATLRLHLRRCRLSQSDQGRSAVPDHRHGAWRRLGRRFRDGAQLRRGHRGAGQPSSGCRRSCSTCSRAWAPTACCAAVSTARAPKS